MKKMSKGNIALSIVLCIILIWAFIAVIPKPSYMEDDNPFMSQEGKPPHIIAHAGGNMEFPDNTLEAFYNAYSVDPDVIMEADVNMTADNVIILSHDRTLDRKTTLIDAPVIETYYSDLVNDAIDFGYENEIDGPNGTNVDGEFIRYTNYEGDTVTPLDVDYPEGVEPRHEEKFLVTTLEDLITSFPDNHMIIEIKQYGETGQAALEEVLRLMAELDGDYNTFARINLASFHHEIYESFLKYQATDYPNLLFSPQEASIREFFTLQLLRLNAFYNDPVTSFQVPMREGPINLATNGFIHSANQHNIAVHYWTINDPDDMRHLIEIGADGILTDRPTLLREIIQEYYE